MMIITLLHLINVKTKWKIKRLNERVKRIKIIMNILGIDPGLGTTGYGIISNQNNNMQLLDFGTITTSPKDNLSKRLKIIFDNIFLLVLSSTISSNSVGRYFSTQGLLSI